MLAVLSSPSSLLDRLSLEGFFVARYLRSWRFDLYTSDLRGGLWGSVDAVVWGWGPSVAVVTGVKVAEGTGVLSIGVKVSVRDRAGSVTGLDGTEVTRKGLVCTPASTVHVDLDF